MPRRTILNDKDSADRRTRAKTRNYMAQADAMSNLPEEPPAQLSGAGAECYLKIAPMLRKLSAVKACDINTVIAFCINYEIMVTGYRTLHEKGAFYEDERGKFVANPAQNAIDKATKNIKALSMELGLTPSARASLIDITKPAEEEKAKVSQAEILKKLRG